MIVDGGDVVVAFYFSLAEMSCCYIYAIRLNVCTFKVSGDQIKAAKRFKKRKFGEISIIISKLEFIPEEYNVYVRYQKEVHGDSRNSQSLYKQCYCQSAIKTQQSDEAPSFTNKRFGTFKLTFRMGGRIFYVGSILLRFLF